MDFRWISSFCRGSRTPSEKELLYSVEEPMKSNSRRFEAE